MVNPYRKVQHRTVLSEVQKQFISEYVKDFNGSRAAMAVGNFKNAASASAYASKTLKHPLVKKAVEAVKRVKNTARKLTQERVIAELYYLATRDAKDFCDEQGRIITNVAKLPRRARSAIDGIEQECVTVVDSDGNEKTTLKTKLKLSPKAAAVDMALKHKGLFAPVEVKGDLNHKIQFDFDALSQAPEQDEIEQKIAREFGEVIDIDPVKALEMQKEIEEYVQQPKNQPKG